MADRQITIGRTELGLSDLNLQDPTNGFMVSDTWSPGGVTWQRYTASASAWVHGNRVVGQRMQSVDEVFVVYIQAADPADLKAKWQTIATALAQFSYTLDIEWDGATYSFTANGAGDIRVSDQKMDPVLHRAGWIALELTIPRDPGVG